MRYTKPLPKPTSDTKPFWDACGQHKLVFQKCAECGTLRWPPSVICPVCYSASANWVPVSGKGKVYTYTVYHQLYDDAFKEDVPYIVAVVELEEGIHFLSNIVGSEPQEMGCDLPVEVVWEDISAEITIPKFRLLREL